jgi:hypothetical protein
MICKKTIAKVSSLQKQNGVCEMIARLGYACHFLGTVHGQLMIEIDI